MKKLSYSIMLMLAVAGVTLINSCGGDDTTTPTPENSPTLTVKPSTDQTVDPGSTLTFTWDARKHPDGKKLTTKNYRIFWRRSLSSRHRRLV